MSRAGSGPWGSSQPPPPSRGVRPRVLRDRGLQGRGPLEPFNNPPKALIAWGARPVQTSLGRGSGRFGDTSATGWDQPLAGVFDRLRVDLLPLKRHLLGGFCDRRVRQTSSSLMDKSQYGLGRLLSPHCGLNTLIFPQKVSLTRHVFFTRFFTIKFITYSRDLIFSDSGVSPCSADFLTQKSICAMFFPPLPFGPPRPYALRGPALGRPHSQGAVLAQVGLLHHVCVCV